MTLLELLQQNTTLLYITSGILGLLVGSFLNVVINRLPTMMERDWREQCHALLETKAETDSNSPFNLIAPRSTCPKCQHKITALENIPLISYLFLRGQCSNCKTKISLQYPAIELATGLLSVAIVWHFGFSLQSLFALFLTWSLIALSIIDIKHTLLPDDITLPFLWLGIVVNIPGLFTDLESSVLGAILGYMILWSVFQVFRLITGKEGMGYGDFKLLAMLGAWIGWQSLAMIILLSSLVGTIIGISMILLMGQSKQKPIPFGPYLAIAGWVALIWGQNITAAYLNWLST